MLASEMPDSFGIQVLHVLMKSALCTNAHPTMGNIDAVTPPLSDSSWFRRQEASRMLESMGSTVQDNQMCFVVAEGRDQGSVPAFVHLFLSHPARLYFPAIVLTILSPQGTFYQTSEIYTQKLGRNRRHEKLP